MEKINEKVKCIKCDEVFGKYTTHNNEVKECPFCNNTLIPIVNQIIRDQKIQLLTQ